MTSIPPPGEAPWTGSWSYAVPDREPPPDPFAQRLLQIAAGLSVLLILVVVNAVLHDDGGNPLNPIAEAAERTQSNPGARLHMEAVYSSASLARPVTMSGTGVYNGRSGRSRSTMAMRAPGPAGSFRMVALGDKRTIYLRAGFISRELPPGRRWMAIDPWLGKSSDSAFGGNGDPRSQLEILRTATGNVEDIGQEDVGGVSTTRYQGTIDMAHYAATLRREGKDLAAQQYQRVAQLAPAPAVAEAWIDDTGLMRRMRLAMTLPARPGDPPMTMDMRIDYSDFGIAPEVRLPEPGEVFDSTPLVRAQLHLLNARFAASSLPAASGPPLSAAAFHTRGSAICEEMIDRVHELRHRAAPRLRKLGELGPGATPESVLEVEREVSYGFIEPALRIARPGLRRLGRLAPPSRLQTDFHHFLVLTTFSFEITLAQARALEVGQFKLANDLSDQLKPISNHADRSAKRAGLDACVDDEQQASS